MKSTLFLPGKASFVLLSLVALCLVLTPSAAQASDITLQGSFTHDDDVQLFNLTVATAGPVDMRSYGYAGGTASTGTVVPSGGFDTILTLFDGSGAFLADNDDGTGAAVDPLTGLPGDARITLNLMPGSYVVALTQFDSFSIGDLADGFAETGNPNFTADPGFTAGGPCPGNLFRDTSGTAGRCRDANWTVDFVNVASVTPAEAVPEPGTVALLGAGLLGIALIRRKKRRAGDGGVTNRRVKARPFILHGFSTVFLFMAALPAHADSFTYDFSAVDIRDGSWSFVYISPHLITTDEDGLLPITCSVPDEGPGCPSISIEAASHWILIEGITTGFSTLAPASVFEGGTNSWGDCCTLSIVRNVGEPTPVPEPSTFVLLLTGLIASIVGWYIRRSSRGGPDSGSRRVIALTAVLLGISSAGARAQGPDYSNVNDFLNGRRKLLAIDDLVVSGVDSAGQIYTSTSTTTNSQLNPASTPPPACCQLGAVIKTLTGHMFNLPSSTTVQLVDEPGQNASQIRLPFVGNGGTGILTAPGLIGGAMADFNGEGYDDLVLYYTGGRIQVATASNVNDPAQSPHFNFGPISTLDTLEDVTVGDFNGDGRPEIAGLVQSPFLEVDLVIYTLDPKTLLVSKATQIPLRKPIAFTRVGESITSGRFTPEAHDQIVVAYSLENVTLLELFEFAPSSLTPQKKTNYTLPYDNAYVMKVKNGKFGLPADPYDQVVFLFGRDNGELGPDGKYLDILSIDPTTLAWTPSSLYDMSSLPCVFDVSVGNFDHQEPDPVSPGQTQHNVNDQIAALYGSCSNGPRNLAILNADPNKFSMSLASVKELPSSLNGLISLSFTESDTQGRSMILGEPTKITLSGSIQPSVVIGVPPMHVDFISPNPAGGAPPQVMNLSAVPDGYRTTYDQEDSTNQKSGSKNTTSWSFGSKESASGSYTIGDPEDTGFNVTDTFKAAQNLKGAAEHDHGTSQRKAFDLSATTGFGDEVSYLDPEFNIWVYPVIGKTVCPAAKPNCPDSEKVPLTIQFSAPNGDALTHATQGQALQWYQPPWEPGNIFSYPANLQQLRSIYPNLHLLTNEGVEFLTDTSTVTEKTSWSVTTKDTATTSLDQNYSFENDFSYTQSVGVKDIATLAGTFKLDLSGSFGFSSLNKNTTDLGASTGVQVSKPGTFPTFQNYAYQVAPYLMGTTKPGGYVDSQPLSTDVQTFGLLRAMFTANPLASSAGAWWQQAYSQAPDVALNHPSRWQITTPALSNPIPPNCLATGTGASQMDCAELTPRLPDNPWLSVFHQMRGFFISGALSPGQGPQLGQATAGDVLTLQARVYNYSLHEMPSGSQVHVRFYFMPWNVNNSVPAGDSVLIGEEELSPIPPFSDSPTAYNSVLASTTFDTSKYEQTKNGAASIVFWVVVWVQTPDGKLMQEMPGHGLTTIPGTLKSLADVAEEGYSNNVGLYKQIFYIAPPAGFVGAPPPAGPASIDISKVDLSADRINPHNTIVVSATLAAIDADASGVSANFYDGDPDKGGRLFDVERIPHIAEGDPHLVQTSYRTNTCGTHQLFVVVNKGKSSEAVRRAHPVRVDCGLPK